MKPWVDQASLILFADETMDGLDQHVHSRSV
jgi:hypothetical protein